jgi:hypothetical protein
VHLQDPGQHLRQPQPLRHHCQPVALQQLVHHVLVEWKHAAAVRNIFVVFFFFSSGGPIHHLYQRGGAALLPHRAWCGQKVNDGTTDHNFYLQPKR